MSRSGRSSPGPPHASVSRLLFTRQSAKEKESQDTSKSPEQGISPVREDDRTLTGWRSRRLAGFASRDGLGDVPEERKGGDENEEIGAVREI
nr:unnamed protein product [Haemonchus contortus]